MSEATQFAVDRMDYCARGKHFGPGNKRSHPRTLGADGTRTRAPGPEHGGMTDRVQDGHTSGSQDFPPLGTDQDRARPEGPVVQGMWMVLLTKTGGWDLDPWRIRHQWRAAVQVDCVRHSRKGDGK